MVVAIWLAVVIVVVPLLGWLLWWWNDIWYGLVMPTFRSSNRGTKLPPGYMGLPIIGELFTFLWYFKVVRRPDDYINFKRSKYGDGIGIYRTHLFGNPSVIAFSPTTNKNVFRDDESFVLKWPNVELVGATSMFSVHGDAHLRIRNFVSRSINQPDALRRVALAVQPRMITAIKSWAERREILTYKELKKVTFESIGMYFVSFKSGVKLDRLEKYCDGVNNGFLAFRFNIPGTTFYHAMQCRKKANNILKEELEKRKNNYYQNQDGQSRPIKDLMDGLMNMKDEEGNNLSDMEILDNIVSFLLGGAESTVLATTWAIYYLAKYPKVLQKLREENMSLKNSKSEQLVTSYEILKLKYTAKVVDETIRLANVAAFVFRRTTKDVKLGEYTIPKGWNIMLWIRYLHMDEGNFDNPMCFNPDRWDTSMPPGTYQPFGGGSRLCAGNMLARLQISTFLYHLSTGYKWELMNPDAKVKYLPYPIPEDNVKITIEKL